MDSYSGMAQMGGQGSDYATTQMGGQGSDYATTQMGGQGSDYATTQMGGQGSDYATTQMGGQGSDYATTQMGGQGSDYATTQMGGQGSDYATTQMGGQGSDYATTQMGGQGSDFATTQMGGQGSDFATTQMGGDADLIRPRAKDFSSPTPFPEDYVATGLNFGTIYSELVHQSDYDPNGTYPGYQFTAQDFEALNVTIDSSGPYSLNEAGVSVTTDGSITVDTNAKIYQSFDDGDNVDVSVAFRVTDNQNQSDIGSVNFQVIGKDENIVDAWQNGKLESNDTVGDLLGKYAVNDVLSTTLNPNGKEASVSFDLYSVGSWDGEDFIVKSGENIILSQPFKASVPFSGTQEGTTITDDGDFKWSLNSEGRSNYGLGNFTQKVAVSIDIPSGLQDVDLSLTSTVDGNINDESWAINEFKVNSASYINPDQRHTDISGGDVLKLGYALKGNDDTGNPGGDASTLGVNDSGLTNVAVLGPNTKSSNSYTLEISGESLKEGWNLESTDIVLKYNSDVFREITTNDITIAGELPVNNAISVDDEKGLIRFAAASLGDLDQGSSIFGKNILASINLSFNDLYFKDSDRNPNPNGKFTFGGNPLGFELSANSDETIFSRTFSSDIDGKEIGGRKSFLVENSQFTGSDIEVISSTKYWAGQQDILHFNTNLDNPNGVKSVVISEQINNEWVDIVSKTAEEIYGENNTLPGSISWAYRSLEDSIGRSSIFGDNALRIQSIYEDAQGTTHATNSYFDKTANPDWAVNQTYGVDGSDSFVFDIDTYTNREIKSLGDLNGNTTFDESKVNLYQAEIKFNEQDDGLTFGTKRVIGANQGFTNLIRTGDTVTAQTSIENIGNSLAQNVTISDAGKVSNAQFLASRFLDSTTDSGSVNLSGGVFNNDFSYDDTKQESVNIAVDMKVTGAAGKVIDVTDGLFQVTAAGMNQNPDTDDTPKVFVSESGSKNLITFQGDLNYDGRVSMKDLAFLNAGAARQVENNGSVDAASVARDVDADFSGKIDIADLSILDNDWGKSLHTGTEDFTGSSDTLNWTSLAKQDGAEWDNSSFTAQNAIEAQDSYIGSLDAPASTTIGADTSSTSQDPVSGEETDQGSSGMG